MRTVPVANKNIKAFYGFLDTEHGIFTMLEGVAVFQASETEELPVVEPGMAWTALGEVGVTEAARILDRLHHGAAWICTHRAQEVA